MRLTTSITLNAPQTQVWDFCVNPQAASACVPGLIFWESQPPEPKFRLILAWGANNSSAGVRIPVWLEWLTQRPPEQLEVMAQIFTGNEAIHIQGQVTLYAVTSIQTRLEMVADVDTTNPLMIQMVQNAAPHFLKPFFQCVKTRLCLAT